MIIDFVSHHLVLMYEFTGLFVVFAGLILSGAFLLARFEEGPLEDAIYFAVVTALTVGFGDIMPRMRGGRFVTVMLAFLGLVLMGVFVALAAEALDRFLSFR